MSFLAVILLSFALAGCRGGIDKNAARSEYISVYLTETAQSPSDEMWLPCAGGQVTVYVHSNVPFDVQWQDGKLPAWLRIKSAEDRGNGVTALTVEFDPLVKRQAELVQRGLYERRDGVLMLTNSSMYLGKYFVMHQGLTKRTGTDFSFLTDGYDIPNKTIGETLYKDWTAPQKAYGYSSTCINGQEAAWCYAKKGYVRLGNAECMGADLVFPLCSSFAYDSLLVVSFSAVAQNGKALGDFTGDTGGDVINEDVPDTPGEGGGTEPIKPMTSLSAAADEGEEPELDNTHLRLEITGGGFIRNEEGKRDTAIDLEVGYYDTNSPDYPSDIFKGAHYLVFIEGDARNPLTAQTSIRLISGSMSEEPASRNNRIFVDDVYVYRMLMHYRKKAEDIPVDMDEDLYELNGRKSGLDKVLGGGASGK